jgi:hypothetical protein
VRIAINDTRRPIPENNAIVTSGWPGFSEVATDAGTGIEIREAFGMSGSPVHEESKSLPMEMSWHPQRRFNAPTWNSKIRSLDDGTEHHNCDVTFHQIILGSTSPALQLLGIQHFHLLI